MTEYNRFLSSWNHEKTPQKRSIGFCIRYIRKSFYSTKWTNDLYFTRL